MKILRPFSATAHLDSVRFPLTGGSAVFSVLHMAGLISNVAIVGDYRITIVDVVIFAISLQPDSHEHEM